MVAVIKTGHSIHRILNYNENKVKEGVANVTHQPSGKSYRGIPLFKSSIAVIVKV